MKKGIIVKVGLIIIAVIVVILILTSLGIKEVSQIQYEEELMKRGEVQYCIPSQYTNESEYKLKECEITKRQTNLDNKEDIIYCEIEVENDYFNATMSAYMYYTYYDKGGWALEDFYADIISATPIVPFEEDMVLNDVLNRSVKQTEDTYAVNALFDGNDEIQLLQFGKLVANGETNLPKEDMDWDAVLMKTVYKSPVLEAECYIGASFDKFSGWTLYDFAHGFDEEDEKVYVHIVSYTADYSKAVGTYSCIGRSHIVDTVLTVSGFNSDYSEIAYSYKTDFVSSLAREGESIDYASMTDPYIYADVNLTEIKNFNPLTGKALIGGARYQYDPIDDCFKRLNKYKIQGKVYFETPDTLTRD